MLVAYYPTKKALKACVGQSLRYDETSAFKPEYKPTGTVHVVGPNSYQRRWYAEVTLVNDIITKVA